MKTLHRGDLIRFRLIQDGKYRDGIVVDKQYIGCNDFSVLYRFEHVDNICILRKWYLRRMKRYSKLLLTLPYMLLLISFRLVGALLDECEDWWYNYLNWLGK